MSFSCNHGGFALSYGCLLQKSWYICQKSSYFPKSCFFLPKIMVNLHSIKLFSCNHGFVAHNHVISLSHSCLLKNHGLFALIFLQSWLFCPNSSFILFFNFRSPSLTKRGASSSSLLSVDNNDSENELIKREQVRALSQNSKRPNCILTLTQTRYQCASRRSIEH